MSLSLSLSIYIYIYTYIYICVYSGAIHTIHAWMRVTPTDYAIVYIHMYIYIYILLSGSRKHRTGATTSPLLLSLYMIVDCFLGFIMDFKDSKDFKDFGHQSMDEPYQR